jgi:hypothetical protein
MKYCSLVEISCLYVQLKLITQVTKIQISNAALIAQERLATQDVLLSPFRMALTLAVGGGGCQTIIFTGVLISP